MSESNPLLHCSAIACGYPGRVVLEDVSLELHPGSLIALLGPNGSGKSTLLKTFCKSIPAIDGTIELNGKSSSLLSDVEVAQQIAYVPQEESPPFRFSVRQIVIMGRLPHSSGLRDTEEDLQIAEDAMRTADCLDLADRAITEISGGEKQRVLIARALAQSAKVLLLDEPTAHLDVGHQVAMSRTLKDLAAKGYAIMAAVHDLNMAASFAQEAVILRDGKVGLHAPIREVLESPMLDEVYGVKFRRLKEGGAFHVFPEG